MFEKFIPALKRTSLEKGRPANFSDLMEEFWRNPSVALPALFKDAAFPAVDVSENDKEIIVKAELPGLAAEDLDISLSRGVLTIKGEKKFEEEEKKDNYHRIERSYGAFARSITLPSEVKEDQITAKCDKGVLTVTLPKEEASKTKKIEVTP
jgi:HSP20 family protein